MECARPAEAFGYPARQVLQRMQMQVVLSDMQGKDKKQNSQLAARKIPAEHREELLTLGEAECGDGAQRKFGRAPEQQGLILKVGSFSAEGCTT